MKYQQNKADAVTRPVKPTKTDQSAGRDTDMNIIVGMMAKTGAAPQPLQPTQFADLTVYPPDLRGMIEQARALSKHMRKLPPQLRNLGPEQLLALKPDELKNILTPAEKPAEPSSEEKK